MSLSSLPQLSWARAPTTEDGFAQQNTAQLYQANPGQAWSNKPIDSTSKTLRGALGISGARCNTNCLRRAPAQNNHNDTVAFPPHPRPPVSNWSPRLQVGKTPQPTTYKDQLTRFPTMSSTILSWRKDTNDYMKAEGNKWTLPQKFRLSLPESLESGSHNCTCTWLLYLLHVKEYLWDGCSSGPHRFEENIA